MEEPDSILEPPSLEPSKGKLNWYLLEMKSKVTLFWGLVHLLPHLWFHPSLWFSKWNLFVVSSVSWSCHVRHYCALFCYSVCLQFVSFKCDGSPEKKYLCQSSKEELSKTWYKSKIVKILLKKVYFSNFQWLPRKMRIVTSFLKLLCLIISYWTVILVLWES